MILFTLPILSSAVIGQIDSIPMNSAMERKEY